MIGAALAAGMLLASASGCGDGTPATRHDEDVTGVTLSLTTVPTDADCYRATFTSGGTSVVKFVTPMGGSTTPTPITQVPPGVYSMLLETFDLACGSVVATTPLSWTGSMSSVTISNGTLTPVTIVLKRPAGTAVSVEYDSAVTLIPSTSPVYDLTVNEPYLYVARGTFVERVPITGGGVEMVVTGSDIEDVVSDATGTYYSDQASIATYWIAPGQPRRLLASKPPYSLALTSSFGLLGLSMAGSAGTGTIERYPTLGGAPVALVTGLYSPYKIVTDGTTLAWYGGTSSGTTVIQKAPVTGGTPTTLFNGSSLSDIAMDSTYVWFVMAGVPGSNSINRVALTNPVPSNFVPVTVGMPSRLLVDATNVYYLVRMYDGLGTCNGAAINKIAKTGGAVTTLWSRPGACPSQLAQSTSYLFFDQGGEVRRIDK
jgi:hypothetical protein